MVRFSLLFASLAACKFSASAASEAPNANEPPVDTRTIDASIDAPPPPACTARSATCLDDVTLSTCACLNTTPFVTMCNWGCIATGTAHCGQLAALGGGGNLGDFTAQGGAPLTLNNAKLNTNDGTSMGVTTGFSAVLRGNVMVFRISGLTLTGTTQFTGPNAAAFVADGAITINAIVDVRGPCAMNAKNAGLGGFNGGNGDAPGMGMGGGAAINSKDCGGAGGGYGGQGGDGGGPSAALGGGAYGGAIISERDGGRGHRPLEPRGTPRRAAGHAGLGMAARRGATRPQACRAMRGGGRSLELVREAEPHVEVVVGIEHRVREVVREQRALVLERRTLEDAPRVPVLLDRDLRDHARHDARAVLAVEHVGRLAPAGELLDVRPVGGRQRAVLVRLADLDRVAVEAVVARRRAAGRLGRAVTIAPHLEVQAAGDRHVLDGGQRREHASIPRHAVALRVVAQLAAVPQVREHAGRERLVVG